MPILSCPLTLRTVKGSRLTHGELDNNFLSLQSCINNVNNSLSGYLSISGGTLLGGLSACTYGIYVNDLYSCGDEITVNSDIIINGNVTVYGSATTFNTEIIQTSDNVIILNYSGNSTTANNGGLILNDAQGPGNDASLLFYNGCWNLDPGFCDLTISGDTFIYGVIYSGGTPLSTIINNTASGAVLYTNSAATPTTIGGIDAGSTFSAQTMQEMWTDLLYPNLLPKFTVFSLVVAPPTVDVGYTIPSGATSFTWTTTNPSFVQANSIVIKDLSAPSTIFTGLADDSSEPYVLPFNIQKTVPDSYSWQIRGTRNTGTYFYRSDSTVWRWRIRWGNSSNTTLTAGDVSGLTNSNLTNTATDTYSFAFGPGTYKHLCFPSTVWTGNNLPQYIRDFLTGFNMAMASPVDGYPTNNGAGWYYDTITSVPNTYGFTTTYRCYRSKNQLGGAMQIKIN